MAGTRLAKSGAKVPNTKTAGYLHPVPAFTNTAAAPCVNKSATDHHPIVLPTKKSGHCHKTQNNRNQTEATLPRPQEGLTSESTRHTGNRISIPYAHIQEIEGRDGEDHFLANGRTVNAAGTTLTEELRNTRRELAHISYDQAYELVS